MSPAQPPVGVIALEHVTRSFNDELAVDRVDLSLHSGRIRALVGLNGAGKTTLMQLMMGMLRPDVGRAVLLGEEAWRARNETWHEVGHMIEVPFGYGELTVDENLRIAARLHGSSRRAAALAARRSMISFQLGHWSDRRAHSLSFGNKQRLGLACALIHEPSVIVLDEPTNGLDPSGVVLLRQLLQTRAEAGAAVVVSSHHLDEVARIADEISVMHRGRLVGALEPGGADLEHAFFELILAADRTEQEES